MSTTPPPISAEDRLSALEARIAELEQLCEEAQLTIPWHVICATVAAVMPDVRIIRVARASGTRGTWQTSALLRNFSSHQIR